MHFHMIGYITPCKTAAPPEEMTTAYNLVTCAECKAYLDRDDLEQKVADRERSGVLWRTTVNTSNAGK